MASWACFIRTGADRKLTLRTYFDPQTLDILPGLILTALRRGIGSLLSRFGGFCATAARLS